ncbi:MAG: hypothetical protein R2702_07305 [Acidimicrobiales bacterium]
MADEHQPDDGVAAADDAAAGRRALLTGGLAVVAGAGAGAAAGALLGRRDEPAPRLAAGSVPGGDGGPWRYIEPGGSVQEAIDAGATAIQLGDGAYPVDAPLRPTPGCTIRGVGERTVLQAVADLPAVVAVGAGGPVGGVVVSDLVVDAAGRAEIGIDLDVVGAAGNLRQEPDAVCRLDQLWVLDAALDGIAYRGTDTQATVTSRVRVRRAGRHGYRIEAPDNVWLACEATTRGTDGAGFWIGVALPGSDGIGAANNHFHACKAWYCHGVGWEVGTGRNAFAGCEAQDTASHGWRITAPRNTLSACVADTAGMADVGGRPGEADGFSVEPGESWRSWAAWPSTARPAGGPPAALRVRRARSLVDAGLLVAPIGWGSTGGLINAR